MKPDTTATTLNQRRDIRKWAMAAVLLLLVTVAGRVQGQTTTTLYQDTFSRTGVLNGSAPDTADANGATWLAGPLIFTGNWTDQNGNSENAAFLSNSVPALPQPICMNAFLPLNAETGHVYTVTASVLVNTNYGLQYMWLGYDVIPSLNENVSGNCAWALIRSTNAPNGILLANQNNGNLQLFAGGGTGGGTTYNWTNSSGTIAPQFITYTMVLDLTNPAALTAFWYTNGVPIRTNVYGSSMPTANNGYWIHYVGFGQNACAGYVTNFSVTDSVPFPEAPTILEQPNSLTAEAGQTATFWVNAIATPDPTYQWMSNSVAIAGATNATYTTPPLSSSYNGASYSVTVSNPANSVPSSPATLTVAAGNPTVFSATKTANPNNIVVNFSGAVDPTTSQNAANYTLNNGASVTAVSPGSVPSSVVLTTSTLNPNADYFLSIQKVQDLFGDVMTNATVPALPAGLVLYLRGDSGMVLDSNGKVVQWLDQTTNDNNASQFFGLSPFTSGMYVPSTLARPTVGTIGPNSLPALTFTPANSNFLSIASAPSVAINSNMTVYVFANPLSSSGTRALICEDIGNIPASFDFEANSGNLQPLLYNGSAGSGATYVGSSAPSLSAGIPHLYSATRATISIWPTNGLSPIQSPFGVATNYNYRQSNSIPCYLDGILDTPINSQSLGNGTSNSVISAPGLADGGQPVFIGWRNDRYTGDIMNGQIGEILLFNTAISGADRTNLDDYLGQKYYPFTIATPLPTTTTTSNGFAVTLSFVANQGAAHFSYQWYENGAAIPGAIGTSYATGILGPSDNGEMFSVVLSLPSGASQTNTTTLDVLNEPPYVTSAGIPVWSTTNIVVLFDEAVNPATVTALANYSLSPSVNIVSATMGDAPNKVILTTSSALAQISGSYSLTVKNVQDLYGNTIATASTTVGLYPVGLGLWLKASSGVTAANGANGAVSAWNDLSGNNNNLVSPPGNNPVLTNNIYGDTVVHFASTSATAYNVMTASDSSSLNIVGDITIAAVMNFNNLITGTNGEIVSETGGSAANIPAPFDTYVGSSSQLFYRGNGSTYGQVTATGVVSTNEPHILIATESGNTVTFFVDGVPAGTGVLSGGFQETNSVDDQNGLFIGARGDSHNRLTGDLSELIVAGSALTTNEVAELNNYLFYAHNVVQTNSALLGLSVSSGNLTLSWPFNHTGWMLQVQTNSVSVGISTNWSNVTSSTNVDQLVVPVNLSNGTVFYRLVYP